MNLFNPIISSSLFRLCLRHCLRESCLFGLLFFLIALEPTSGGAGVLSYAAGFALLVLMGRISGWHGDRDLSGFLHTRPIDSAKLLTTRLSVFVVIWTVVFLSVAILRSVGPRTGYSLDLPAFLFHYLMFALFLSPMFLAAHSRIGLMLFGFFWFLTFVSTQSTSGVASLTFRSIPWWRDPHWDWVFQSARLVAASIFACGSMIVLYVTRERPSGRRRVLGSLACGGIALLVGHFWSYPFLYDIHPANRIVAPAPEWEQPVRDLIAHHPMLDSSWQKTSNLHQNHGITTITAAVRGGLPLPPMPNALGVPYARQEGYTFTARFDDGHIEKKRHLIRHPREPISPFNLNGFPNGQYDGESLRLYRGKGMEVPSSLSGEVLMRVEQPYVIDEGPFRSDMVLNYGYGGDRSVQIRGYRILEGGKRLKLTVSRKIPVTVFHRDRDEVLIAVSRIREITAFQRRTGVLHEPAESIQVFLAPEGVVLTPRWVEGASVGLFGTNIIARFEVPFDVEREGLRRSR